MLKAMDELEPYPRVIVSCVSASLGFNYFKECFVLMTDKPASKFDYVQMIGRSNRMNPDSIMRGCLILEKNDDTMIDQSGLERSLHT